MQIIPFDPSNPNHEFTCQLDGAQYLLRARWNARDLSYYLDVSDEAGDPIRVGIRIVLGALLGARCSDARFPPGLLIAVDTSSPTGMGIDAGIDDLGARVQVWYYPLGDLSALAPGAP